MREAIRRPPKVVQGVLDMNFKILANSASPSPFIYLLHLKASDPSLFLSPGGRAFRRADPKIFLWPLVARFFFDFFDFQNALRFLLRKNIEKHMKI